jgi:hypothetical protein
MFRCIVAALLLTSVSGQVQLAVADDQSQTIQDLLKRVHELELKVSQLQSEKSAVPMGESLDPDPNTAAPQALNQPPSRAEHLEHNASGLSSDEQLPSLHLRGFADVDFSATDQHGGTNGFNMGQFILQITSPLTERVAFFGEVSLTAQPSNYSVDLERAFIRYELNDYFKVSFGRYHTPINYWNTAFHHGLWLQTTIARPDMIRFGGRFEPVHFIGLLTEGNIPSGRLGLGYDVGLGNGRSSILSRPGDTGAANNSPAWVTNVFARPIRGLQFGGSFYGDKISPSPALPGNPQVKELISSAHLVWNKETPEFLAEFANVHHRNMLTGAGYDSRAFYAQLGYRLPGLAHRWKPYYRFERTEIPPNEPVFAVSDPALAVVNLTGSTLGVRYDFTDFAAFKMEYRNTKKGSEPAFNGAYFQTSFTF